MFLGNYPVIRFCLTATPFYSEKNRWREGSPWLSSEASGKSCAATGDLTQFPSAFSAFVRAPANEKGPFPDQLFYWQEQKESNPHQRFWRPLFYH